MKMADLPSTVIHRIVDEPDEEAAKYPTYKVGRGRTQAVLDALRGECLSTDQLIERSGLNHKDLSRVVSALVRSGHIRCVGLARRPKDHPSHVKTSKIWKAT